MIEYPLEKRFEVQHELGGVPSWVLPKKTYYNAKPRLVSGRRPVPDEMMREAETIVLPVEETVVRQVAGVLARRIICHARADEHLLMGARFGMIKFGSRTELIIPRHKNTEIKVGVGDKVKAGLTIVARQPLEAIRTDAAIELQHAAT